MKYRVLVAVSRKWPSLPTWERGLKFHALSPSIPTAQSLPTWERGLKCVKLATMPEEARSLPTWERGLKYGSQNSLKMG